MANINAVDLESLFRMSVDLLCVSTLKGEILAVNPAYLSSFGYTETELVGRSFLSLVHPDDVPATLAVAKGTGQGSTLVLFENRCTTASGEVRWFQWSARSDPSRDRTYASGRDVTNQRGDRERLQRYADLLERTQRELKDALEELTRVANTDQLTGLMNRRAFEAKVADELSRSARAPRDVTLLMLDIDHFKAVNDTHGHPMGDVVLREVARRIETGRRQHDVVARWGGEEFVALLPDTSGASAKVVAERFALAVAARPIVLGSLAVEIRMSGGVVSRRGDLVATAQELLDAADRALLRAKENGRDRIELSD
jgi:diguanylate cyclase (GGDEF)-like protein/PAS domain S-box-containing protein